MPKRIPPLSEEQIKHALPQTNSYKLFDGGGLLLQITPTGSKLWRLNYYFDGKRKNLTLGSFPAITLDEARRQAGYARDMLANGIDPSEVRKAQKVEYRQTEVYPRISVCMDGVVEIWKGRNVIRLSKEEAIFIKDQLVLLT